MKQRAVFCCARCELRDTCVSLSLLVCCLRLPRVERVLALAMADWMGVIGGSVKSQMVNIPSFLVRVEQEKHIEFALTSPYGPGRPGRCKRKSAAAGGGGGDGDDE
jgi:hypothetical protein